MPSSQEFADYIVGDLLADVPDIRTRKMFGGYGIYKGGVFFGLISDDVLYFKVNAESQKKYEKLDSKPFQYFIKGRGKVTLSYWEVPVSVMENNEELLIWTNEAVRAGEKVKHDRPSR